MKYISSITSEPKQSFFFPVEGYERATFSIEFKPQQNGWFFSLDWQDFSIANQQLTTGANVLRAYSRVLPFGICVNSLTSQDPVTYDAFITDCKLYFLDSADLAEMETILYGT
jgi:hypothetical protein